MRGCVPLGDASVLGEAYCAGLIGEKNCFAVVGVGNYTLYMREVRIKATRATFLPLLCGVVIAMETVPRVVDISVLRPAPTHDLPV